MNVRFPALARLVRDRAADPALGGTRHITTGAGAVEALAGWSDRWLDDHQLILVADAHTYEAAGAAVEGAFTAHGRAIRHVILEPRPGDDHLVCEDGVIAALKTLLAASDGLRAVAVGAGTVNDIAKMASHELDRDYVAVPTAASMNGYTSAIAAVLRDGVKRTLPARQPIAIAADTAIIQAAPHHMNAAGFGDLLSKPYSHADWLLSHCLRDEPYDAAPATLLDDAYDALLDEAAAIGRAEPAGIETLTAAILLSGFSMTMAGTSAPASGGEHLVSHYWDMEQLDRGLSLHGLHGTQVGIATLMSAHLFERLLALDVATLDVDALAARRPDATWMDDLAVTHETLSAPVVAEIRAQLAQKQRHGAALAAELRRFAGSWPEIRRRLQEGGMPSSTALRSALKAAGCADRPSAIGIDAARATHTLRVCRHIRSRYVALDLMDDLAVLAPWADAVVREVEAA